MHEFSRIFPEFSFRIEKNNRKLKVNEIEFLEYDTETESNVAAYTDQQLMDDIDETLKSLDVNLDGYIDFPEYSITRRG